MGIYDREYYRDGPGFWESFAGRGRVCKWLIGINAVIFLLQVIAQQGNTPSFITQFLWLDVPGVLHGQVWRLLTYAFVHDPFSIWHILFNMLFLWWFGSDVEDIYGSREFLAFYLIAALLGGLLFTLLAILQGTLLPCLGASGAVMAVMVVCAMHFPRRVILLFFILPVPIWLFVGFKVAMDLFGFLTRTETAAAVEVHLAGALFGLLYFKRQWRLAGLWPNFRNWQRPRSRPKLRIYREVEAHVPPSANPPPPIEVDEQLEAQLDAVLEKVARHGQSSLTDSERQILFRASELYKKRRT
ncbi:MAG: rhomboid family intramembrane serine protease [Gemmataceae bacterium]